MPLLLSVERLNRLLLARLDSTRLDSTRGQMVTRQADMGCKFHLLSLQRLVQLTSDVGSVQESRNSELRSVDMQTESVNQANRIRVTAMRVFVIGTWYLSGSYCSSRIIALSFCKDRGYGK